MEDEKSEVQWSFGCYMGSISDYVYANVLSALETSI